MILVNLNSPNPPRKLVLSAPLSLQTLLFYQRSATDSVISLPLLNMVRGVPFSHRGSSLPKLLHSHLALHIYIPVVPLRVTNPDRMSM
jgi:hypothetical protein